MRKSRTSLRNSTKWRWIKNKPSSPPVVWPRCLHLLEALWVAALQAVAACTQAPVVQDASARYCQLCIWDPRVTTLVLEHHRGDMDLAVCIGGYVVQIQEPENHPPLTWPLRPFDTFLLSPSLQSDLSVKVAVVAHLPELPTGPLRFDSAHGCWKLFESDAGLLFESLDPKNFQPRVRALVSDDYRTLRAWILPDLQGGQVGWTPMQLFNPLIEVCLLSRLARDGGLLLHAAGLSFHEQGYVFTGASGTGKSTIAEFFASRGAAVLSDERLILRRHGTGFSLYGTPWVGSGNYAENSSAPITGLFCINHGQDRHRIESLSPSKTITLLLQQAFLPYWDRVGMETTLDFLASLTAQVPCYSLAFLKEADVVDQVLDCSSPSPIVIT